MPTPADRQHEEDPQPLRPPKKSHHAPSMSDRRIPSSTFSKGNDDDAAAARTCPRVSPGMRRGEGKGGGYPDALQERLMAPVGVTASVSGEPTRISPDPQEPPPRSIRTAPPSLPPTSMRHHGIGTIHAVSLWSSLRGLGAEKGPAGAGVAAPQLTGGNYLHRDTFAVADRTREQGTPGPYWPGRALTGPQSPVATLQQVCCARRHHPATAGAPPPPPGSFADAQEADGPPQPRWGPNGPRSGPTPAPPAPPGRSASQQGPRHRSSTPPDSRELTPPSQTAAA